MRDTKPHRQEEIDRKIPSPRVKGRKGNNMKIHEFHKTTEGAYLFPVYVRDDGKYKIASVDRCICGAVKRVFEVTNEAGEVVGTLMRLRDAKTSYEME